MKRILKYSFFVVFALVFSSCHSGNNQATEENKKETNNIPVNVPDFNADSAYLFTQKQVDFGPRIPNTPAQDKCAAWLTSKLKEYTPNVEVQDVVVTAYNGTSLKCKNIIANLYPEKKNRILLCSHWDTRPWADQDSLPKYQRMPFDGANDGPSGVGVILEIARQMAKNKPNLGVTIVLLDAEDYGVPEWDKSHEEHDSYCLGTQYWANHLDHSKYYADYGILLDMVGAKGSRFLHEGVSSKYAGPIVDKVWKQARALGYGQYFIFNQTSPITDDHVYINTIAQIPTIDIIDFDGSRSVGFGYYWHTHYDDMKIIDKDVLKAVGQTLMAVIFNEH